MGAMKDNQQSLFFEWLAKAVTPAQLSELYQAFVNLENDLSSYTYLHSMARPLSETADAAALNRLYGELSGNSRFMASNRSAIKLAVLKHYARYCIENRQSETEYTPYAAMPAPKSEPLDPGTVKRNQNLFARWLRDQNFDSADIFSIIIQARKIHQILLDEGETLGLFGQHDIGGVLSCTKNLNGSAAFLKGDKTHNRGWSNALKNYMLFAQSELAQGNSALAQPASAQNLPNRDAADTAASKPAVQTIEKTPRAAAGETAPQPRSAQADIGAARANAVQSDNNPGDDSSLEPALSALLTGERYAELRAALVKNRICALDAFKQINLWVFMNQNGLYSIGQRQEIYSALRSALAALESNDSGARWNLVTVKGEYSADTPAAVLMEYCRALAAKYPLRFRGLIGQRMPGKFVAPLMRNCARSDDIRSDNPVFYIGSGIGAEMALYCARWICESCRDDDVPQSLAIDAPMGETTVEIEQPETQPADVLKEPTSAQEQPAQEARPEPEPEPEPEPLTRWRLDASKGVYFGATPAAALLEYCRVLASSASARLSALVGRRWERANAVPLMRERVNVGDPHMTEPEFYINREINANTALIYAKWICSMCRSADAPRSITDVTPAQEGESAAEPKPDIFAARVAETITHLAQASEIDVSAPQQTEPETDVSASQPIEPEPTAPVAKTAEPEPAAPAAQAAEPAIEWVEKTADLVYYADYLNTRPVSVAHKGTTVPLDSWDALYRRVCKMLYADHMTQMLQLVYSHSLSGVAAYFATSATKGILPSAMEFTDGCYIESNLSATSVMERVRSLLQHFGAADQFEIRYLAPAGAPKARPQLHETPDIRPITGAGETTAAAPDEPQADARWKFVTRKTEYFGAAPAALFAEYCRALAEKYPAKFKGLVGQRTSNAGSIPLMRSPAHSTDIRLDAPEAYIDANMSADEALACAKWVCERCRDNDFIRSINAVRAGEAPVQADADSESPKAETPAAPIAPVVPIEAVTAEPTGEVCPERDTIGVEPAQPIASEPDARNAAPEAEPGMADTEPQNAAMPALAADVQPASGGDDENTKLADLKFFANYIGTNPVSLKYRGELTMIDSWPELYRAVCSCLYRDYTEKMLELVGDNLSGGLSWNYANEITKAQMKAPLEFAPGCYCESDLPATSIMGRVRSLVQYFGAEAQFEIRYESIGERPSAPQTPQPATVEPAAPISDPEPISAAAPQSDNTEPAPAPQQGDIEEIIADLNSFGDYENTAPVSLTYNGELTQVNSWRELYRQVCRKLYDSHITKMLEIVNSFDLSGIEGQYANRYTKYKMTTPWEFAPGCYCDTGLPNSKIMERIAILVKYFGAEDQFEIRYRPTAAAPAEEYARPQDTSKAQEPTKPAIKPFEEKLRKLEKAKQLQQQAVINAQIADLDKSADYDNTKPVCLKYRDKTIMTDSWQTLYLELCKMLFVDYKEKILHIIITHSPSWLAAYFADESAKAIMRRPKKFADNCYIEINLSANDTMGRIRNILQYLGAKDNVEIRYKLLSNSPAEPLQATQNEPAPAISTSIDQNDKADTDNSENNSIRTADFERYYIRNYENAEPFLLEYEGYVSRVDTWLELYVGVCKKLYADHTAKMLKLVNDELTGYFANDKMKPVLRKPLSFEQGCYLESDLSPSGIMGRIRNLLKYFNALNQFKITYKLSDEHNDKSNAVIYDEPPVTAKLEKEQHGSSYPDSSKIGAAWKIESRAITCFGATPAEVLAEYCRGLAMRFPAKVRSLVGLRSKDYDVPLNPKRNKPSDIYLFRPEAYIDANIDAKTALKYAKWIYAQCGGASNPPELTAVSGTAAAEHNQSDNYDIIDKTDPTKQQSSENKASLNQNTAHPAPAQTHDDDFSIADLRYGDNYANTKPVFVEYEGVKRSVTSWQGAYIEVCRFMYSAHMDQMLGLVHSDSISGIAWHYADLHSHSKMRAPREFVPGCYLESNLSATGIMARIRNLVQYFGGADRLKIAYVPLEDAPAAPKPAIKIAPQVPPITRSVPKQPALVTLEPARPLPLIERPEPKPSAPAAQPAIKIAPPVPPITRNEPQPSPVAPAPKTAPEYSFRRLEEVERLVLASDLAGMSLDQLYAELPGVTMVALKRMRDDSPNLVEIADRLIHVEAFVDWDEGARKLDDILDKLMAKNNGYVSNTQLFEYAHAEMQMFLNDNDMDDPRKVFDMAQHLFEKQGYRGRKYTFSSKSHISRGDGVTTNLDVIKKFAQDRGGFFRYDDLVEYLEQVGIKTGNLRNQMQLGIKPIFFYYSSDDLISAESMRIDGEWLDRAGKALGRLFADMGDHVVLRAINPIWYDQLPALPGYLPWTPLLLQYVLQFYGSKLNAKTIGSELAQKYDVLHAMLVRPNGEVQTFADAVVAYLVDSGIAQRQFEAEELRARLVEGGLIAGGELMLHMQKAIGSDPRFAWNASGGKVSIKV